MHSPMKGIYVGSAQLKPFIIHNAAINITMRNTHSQFCYSTPASRPTSHLGCGNKDVRWKSNAIINTRRDVRTLTTVWPEDFIWYSRIAISVSTIIVGPYSSRGTFYNQHQHCQYPYHKNKLYFEPLYWIPYK